MTYGAKLGSALIMSLAMIFFPQDSKAALINSGIFTTDTVSGLDWLDFSATKDLSTTYVSENFATGGRYAGWRFAEFHEVKALFDNAGATGPYDGTYSTVAFNGAASTLISLMGATHSVAGVYNSASVHFSGNIVPELGGFMIREWIPNSQFDLLDIRQIMFATGGAEIGKAHALVRTTAASVPEPPTLFLFSIALIGMLRSSFYGKEKTNIRFWLRSSN